MAKKEEKTVKLERNYTIPLRKAFLKAPAYRRAKRAVSEVRIFATRHMKASEVKIGKYLNLALWKHGIKNPPHHVKVVCTKDAEGIVKVELEGAPTEKMEAPKKAITKGLKKEKKSKAEQKIEKKAAEVKEEQQEKAKEIQKEEIRELKKEHPHVHAPRMPPPQKTQDTHPPAPKQK